MKLYFLLLYLTMCSSSNILLMFPLSLKSHVNAFFPLFKKLSEKGHNLTMVIPFKPKVILDNCTYITVRSMFEEEMLSIGGKFFYTVALSSFTTDALYSQAGDRKERYKYLSLQTLMISGKESLQRFRNMQGFKFWPTLWDMYSRYNEKFLREGCLEKLLIGNYSFDLMISETLYLQELFVAFGHIYNVPVINIDSHAPSAWSSYLTGNVNPYAFVPNFKSPFTDHMTFGERLENTLLNLFEVVGCYYYFLPKQESLMKKYLIYEKGNFPPLLDMLRNTSLTLVDSHFSLGYIRPYLPNMIEVGGLTFNSDFHLTEEYQQYLDRSKDGIIYVSFGSAMNISLFPQDLVDTFSSAFSQLKQNVIMKWEVEELPNKPKNVKTSTWLPQNGILAHPHCSLFITHGGIHGLSEAIFHEVPLVIIPFFSDQYYNAKFAEKEGFAYVLNNLNLTTENFLYAINSALGNPEFKKNIKRRSLILKDKDQSALDKAVYWVEYVIKHNGAKHLRPASLDLNFFQYFLLDIIFLGCIVCFIGFLLIFVILYILAKSFRATKLIYKQKND